MKTRLIFVGGFLGAGKTTLLYEITRLLTESGKKTGLITNDQAPDLVDTSILGHIDVKVAEVAGSCFCCDFKGLRRAIDNLSSDNKPDFIIAEPVGSCTDLSATLINPIKDMMKNEIAVSPLTVLADPKRLTGILDGTASIHPGAAYIIKKQLEESDIIVITKTDLYSKAEINSLSERLQATYPECRIMTVSSKNGEGIEEWLDYVITSNISGKHIAEIDYDKYAEGEAVLGWLNCSASLSGKDADWDEFARTFMNDFATAIDKKNLSVGHMKIMVENGDKYIAANLTGGSETLSFRWSAGTSDSAKLVVNARIEMTPEEVEALFKDILGSAAGDDIKIRIERLKSLSPGRPNPTYRYNHIVE